MEVMNKKGDMIVVPSPFSWSAANANCRIERSVLVMQKVLCKMFITKHKITLKYPKEMDLLRKALAMIQEKCMQAALYFPREAWSQLLTIWGTTDLEIVKGSEIEVIPIFEKIGRDKKLASFRDPFDLWSILQMLAGYIYNRLDIQTRIVQKIPLESYPEMLQPIIKNFNVDQQNSIWDQVLDALGDHLVPYSHLVEIFCMGETRRRCGSCKRDTTIEMVKHVNEGPLDLRPCLLRPFISGYGALVTNHGSLISCHRKACFKKISKLHAHIHFLLWKEYTEKQQASFKCDQCFFLCEKVHRCKRCWTKVYCTEDQIFIMSRIRWIYPLKKLQFGGIITNYVCKLDLSVGIINTSALEVGGGLT